MLWDILFGSIGMGYIIYGKKRERIIVLIAGVLLCVFPYFVSNTIAIALIGIVLILMPFFIPYYT